MKKLLSIGVLAFCALVISEHRAQAWVNSKFGIGLSWHHQSANTSTLWGLWRNGQIPGPEAFGGGGPPPGGMAPPVGAPVYPPGPAGGFPFFGGQTGPATTPPGGGTMSTGMQFGNLPPTAFFQGMPQGFPYAFPAGVPQTFPTTFQQGLPTTFTTSNEPPLFNPTRQMSYNTVSQGSYAYNPQLAPSYPAYGYYYQPTYFAHPQYNYAVPYYWYGSR